MGMVAAGPRPTLLDALTPVLAMLDQAGIRVTLDYSKLNPTGCYLGPPELDYRFKAGDFTANYTLLVVAGANDGTQAVRVLSAELDRVIVALGSRPVTARPVAVVPADASSVLLGMEISWSDRIRGNTNGGSTS
jgi:hypothetical protein